MKLSQSIVTLLILNSLGILCAANAQNAAAIDFGDDSSTWAEDGECDDPRFSGDGMASTLQETDTLHDATDCESLYRSGDISLDDIILSAINRSERGSLKPGDETLTTDEYVDRFNFEGLAGQSVIFDLRSEDFDTYLIVTTPSGEQFDNDDFEGDQGRSLVSMDLTESGSFEILATSYESGESGIYTLTMNSQSSANIISLNENGRLESGDNTLTSGEFVDTYKIEARPGQRLRISLASSDFDPYVILQSPDGISEEDDDSGDGSNSLIETEISEVGTYRVLVTSFESGEAGPYQLVIDELEANENTTSRDLIALEVGGTQTGMLQVGDLVLEDGEYQDVYVFDGVAGESIRIDLRSSDFDTYVGLVTPDGENIDNDDFEGSTEHSAIEFTIQQTGRFRVFATSYGADEIGQYSLSLNRQAQNSDNQLLLADSEEGKTYGVFAGIADYPGSDNDLIFIDQDPLRVRDALIEGGGMNPDNAVTLIDSQATRANFESAIRDIAGKMQPEDTFVLFFSGHGAQVNRTDGFESSDPDNKDETIELYDGAILDNELNDMLALIDVGTTLIVLDSCFSGGFAKDIISVPGRMGLFSSEEDVTSQVAAKFRAGGYLSYFFEEALLENFADSDSDGHLSAIELSQYLHERFRSDVKAFNENEYVRTAGPQNGYQHLVVDRGSISPYDILF